MNNYFIIHGAYGNPCENWFPWLEKELSNNKISCIIPHFPTPKHQNFTNWENLLNYYFMLGLVHDKTIFIAHSLGPIFIAKYVIKNKIKIKGLISVAGFNDFFSGNKDFDDINKSFFMENSELSKFTDYSNFSHCFISDNDPYIPMDKLKQFSNIIKADLHIIPNGGHFNIDAGYVKFVEVIEIIKDTENL
jgi:hypothetical protein